MTTIRALAALLCLTAMACSVIIDIEECRDNSQCILEDGTQLVCGPDETIRSCPWDCGTCGNFTCDLLDLLFCPDECGAQPLPFPWSP